MKNIIVSVVFILLLAGCEGVGSRAAPESKEFTVMVWNVQNLFDGEENGYEYAEFREEAGWTQEKYRARIVAISQAIGLTADIAAIPDLIGLVEVENGGVLDDLCKGSLSKHEYRWTAFANLPGSALGIGILSRFPLKDARAHSITAGKETAPRPVLEVRVEPRGKPLVFLLCHWKSKLGNDTEALRRASARVIQRRLCELKKTEPETPVIVMGDLNENYDEFYRELQYSALLPDDPDAVGLAEQSFLGRDFLVLSAKKPPRSLYVENIPALYSPWEEELESGSYYYKGNWETIDHFLLSEGAFNDSGWEYSGFRVLNEEPFANSKGTPNIYAIKSGKGLSDHLPLLLFLRDLSGD